MELSGKGLKVGMLIHYEGGLYRVLDAQIIAPGNWRAFVQTKLRNISTGSQTQVRFRTDERIERAVLDVSEVEFLYREGDFWHFMDTESYEQFHMTPEDLGDAAQWITPNLKLKVERYEGKPMGVELPKSVTLKVTETEPFLKGATVTTSFKPAKLETGAVVQVPGFVSVDDIIEVDPTEGKYIGRSK